MSATGAAGALVDVLRDRDVLTAAEWHTAEAVCRLVDEPDDDVRLAVALAVRAVRHGHVCLELDRLAAQGLTDDDGQPVDVTLPEADPWIERLAASPAVRQPDEVGPVPLVLDGRRLHLDRYWRHEQRLADGLLDALGAIDDRDPSDVDAVLDRLFDESEAGAGQREAARRVAGRRLVVLTGGPGTGKTTTVVRMLAVLAATAPAGAPPRMVLAAPTGKAAARMAEAVRADVDRLGVDDTVVAHLRRVESSTLHRLLGWNPGRPTRFRHDASNPLPHDVVVVDEASMVSLPLMTRLVDALGPSARLVLVGDREQLTSIDAGAVLADVAAAGRMADSHVHLTHTFRFGVESGIFEVARAVERGVVDDVLDALDGRHDDVRLVDAPGGDLDAEVWTRIVDRARALGALARSGADPAEVLAAADAFRVLAPLRRGPQGVDTLNRRIAAALATGTDRLGTHPVGTPLIVTRNDHVQRLYNGDVGVVVPDPARDRGVVAFWAPGGDVRLLATSRLPPHEPVHAMSVHRSQGSQFDEVIVVLPGVDTPLLTRELVYTAVTRARRDATIHGAAPILRGAIERRVQRASGLRERLQA